MVTNLEYTHVLVRVASEIFLKGKNQNTFMSRLRDNIKLLTGQKQIIKQRARIILPYFDDHYMLKRVFGVHSYSLAVFIPRTDQNQELQLIKQIQETAITLLADSEGTFHCQTKRSDKSFPKTSVELNHLVGMEIEKSNSNLQFQLKNPDHVLGVEISDKGVFIFKDKVICPGGLPAGVEGEVGVFFEDQNSVLAALLMLKRGVNVTLIKGDSKNEKKSSFEQDLSLLQNFSPRSLKIFDSFQEYKIACKNKLCVVVTSDTVESLIKQRTQSQGSDQVSPEIVYLYPLCAYTKDQAEKELGKYQQLIS